jgi:O-antigen/teichoic acid export membrane protein
MTAATDDPAIRGERAGAMRAVWSALDAAATPLSSLLMLAALVRSLGPAEYGVLVIAIAASGLCLAVNPAITATTTKFVSELSASRAGAKGTVAGVITIALLGAVAIDLCLLLAAAVFNPLLRGWVFGGAAAAGTPHLGVVLWLAVLSMALQQIETVLSGAIRGLERFRRQALIELMSRAALLAAVLSVAWQTRSLLAILGAQCTVYAVSIVVRAVALRRLLPRRRLFARPHWAEAASLIRYGGWMGLTALAGVVYTSIDRVIVGRVLGTAAAGGYSAYLQITQLVHFVPTSMFAFALPLFSRLIATEGGRAHVIGRAFNACLLGVTATGLIVAAALLLGWPLLIGLLAGSSFGADRPGVAILLLLNFLLLACNVAPYYLLVAVGQARAVALVTTVSMLAALVLMLVLIPRYGLVGAALARLAYGVGSLMLLPRALGILKSGEARDGR